MPIEFLTSMHAWQNLISLPHRQHKTRNSLNSASLEANYRTKCSVKQELGIQCEKPNLSLGREQQGVSGNRDAK